jgi:hypothetical protein
MNATKKISSILALGAIGAMVLTGCSKTITRADAMTLLGNIAVHVSKNYSYPTKFTETATVGETSYTSVKSPADNYYHSTYKGDYAVSKTVTLSNTEVYAYKDSTDYVVSYKDGNGNGYYKGSDKAVSAAFTLLGTGVTAAIASIIYDTPVEIKDYLANFADGNTGLVTGATVRTGTIMDSESYKTKGDGNLSMTISPNYTGEGDEVMSYDWDNYLIQKSTNELKKSKTEYSWNKASLDKKADSSYTAMDAAGAVVALALL